MKVWISLILALTLTACAHNPNVTTPEGKAAQAALEISTRIGELQDAAITANASGGINDRDAVTVVKFTVAAQKTLKAAPDGWRVSVKASYDAMKAALDTAVRVKLAATLSLLDVLLGAL